MTSVLSESLVKLPKHRSCVESPNYRWKRIDLYRTEKTKSSFDFEAKHRVLLGEHPFTLALIRLYHKKERLLGTETLLALLYVRYWIIGERRLIRGIKTKLMCDLSQIWYKTRIGSYCFIASRSLSTYEDVFALSHNLFWSFASKRERWHLYILVNIYCLWHDKGYSRASSDH